MKVSYAWETFLPNRKILTLYCEMRFISILPVVSLANDYFGDKVYRVKAETEYHLFLGFQIDQFVPSKRESSLPWIRTPIARLDRTPSPRGLARGGRRHRTRVVLFFFYDKT